VILCSGNGTILVQGRRGNCFPGAEAFECPRMRGTHGQRGARAYNGGLGWSPQRGPGAKPLVRGLGREAHEAERFAAMECPNEAAFWPFLGVLET